MRKMPNLNPFGEKGFFSDIFGGRRKKVEEQPQPEEQLQTEYDAPTFPESEPEPMPIPSEDTTMRDERGGTFTVEGTSAIEREQEKAEKVSERVKIEEERRAAIKVGREAEEKLKYGKYGTVTKKEAEVRQEARNELGKYGYKLDTSGNITDAEGNRVTRTRNVPNPDYGKVTGVPKTIVEVYYPGVVETLAEARRGEADRIKAGRELTAMRVAPALGVAKAAAGLGKGVVKTGVEAIGTTGVKAFGLTGRMPGRKPANVGMFAPVRASGIYPGQVPASKLFQMPERASVASTTSMRTNLNVLPAARPMNVGMSGAIQDGTTSPLKGASFDAQKMRDMLVGAGGTMQKSNLFTLANKEGVDHPFAALTKLKQLGIVGVRGTGNTASVSITKTKTVPEVQPTKTWNSPVFDAVRGKAGLKGGLRA